MFQFGRLYGIILDIAFIISTLREASMEPRLSALQRKSVWEGWLSAEIRAHYFAELCHDFQWVQRVVTWGILAASSGALASLVAGLPDGWHWLRPALALATAGLSLWSLVANYSKNSSDCSDLHLRWNRLAIDYQALWEDMYTVKAPERLSELLQRDAELSKSSTALPNREPLMRKWQARVVNHHALDGVVA